MTYLGILKPQVRKEESDPVEDKLNRIKKFCDHKYQSMAISVDGG